MVYVLGYWEQHGSRTNAVKADDLKPSKTVSVTDLDAATYQSALASETVQLLVGPKRKAFGVHKDLLTQIVPAFGKIVAKHLPDKKINDIYLVGHDPSVIQLFVGWLYRGASALYVAEKSLVPLARLYATAAKWNQSALQNAIIDVLVAHFRNDADGDLQPIHEVVQWHYDEISPFHELRSLIMFHTVVAYNRSIQGKLGMDSAGLGRLIGSCTEFAADFAFWQVVFSDMTQPENLCYEDDINKRFHVGQGLGSSAGRYHH